MALQKALLISKDGTKTEMMIDKANAFGVIILQDFGVIHVYSHSNYDSSWSGCPVFVEAEFLFVTKTS